MLQGARSPSQGRAQAPTGAVCVARRVKGVPRGWDGDRAGEGRGKRQEEQKALVPGGQLGRGSNTGRRGFPGAAMGSMFEESSSVAS